MRWLAGGLAAALVVVSAPVAAQTTITFSNLPPGNPPVTTYTENGFTFTTTAGSFSGTTGFGAPPPSVYTPNNSGTAVVTNGGRFTFSSVALGNGAFSGAANFTITGFLNNAQVFSFFQAVPATQFNTYQNPNNSNTIIDRLQFVVTGDGNIDNIVVRAAAAAPEPSTWGLMLFGFGVVGMSMRRRRHGELRNASAV